MNVLVGPVHLRHVNETFNTLFQLGKAAVVGKVGDLGLHAAALGVATGDLDPGVFTELLETE